jgi:FkbH-like protein
MEGYLASLGMVAVVRPFEAVSIPRITQLTNKTNQFNLTTRRVTQSEVEAMASDPAWVTRSLRLSDRFGDHGLVSVFFARRDGTRLVVEGWLMSCRVIARGAEQALFGEVLSAARALGVEEIVGLYRPTDRNDMVRDLYRGLGFELVSESAQETRWRLAVAGAAAPPHHIRIERGEEGP